MLEFDVTVGNERGLHARPAARIVSVTTGFASDVRMIYGEREVDAKSIMGLLILAAPRGARVRVVVDGPDERDARDRVVTLFDATPGAGPSQYAG